MYASGNEDKDWYEHEFSVDRWRIYIKFPNDGKQFNEPLKSIDRNSPGMSIVSRYYDKPTLNPWSPHKTVFAVNVKDYEYDLYKKDNIDSWEKYFQNVYGGLEIISNEEILIRDRMYKKFEINDNGSYQISYASEISPRYTLLVFMRTEITSQNKIEEIKFRTRKIVESIEITNK